MNKIIILLALIVASVATMHAQEKGACRAGLELGYVMPQGKGSLAASAEFKYNLLDNLNVGVRWTTAWMAMQVGGSKSNLAGNAGYFATLDHYFNKGHSRLAPFVGVGAGLFVIDPLYIDKGEGMTPEVNSTEYKFTGLVRAGVEYRRFRLNVEYTLMSNSTMVLTNSTTGDCINHTIRNSYFGINLGAYLGGGKWKKH